MRCRGNGGSDATWICTHTVSLVSNRSAAMGLNTLVPMKAENTPPWIGTAARMSLQSSLPPVIAS